MSALAAALAALALLQETPLADPAAEARAQALMREIRCVTCENEPISQSASDMAGDMRTMVRAKVAEGESNAAIRAWFAERYGEFVLFRPKARGPGGWLLWGAPLLLLLAGAGGVALARRKPAGQDIAAVPPERLSE